MVVLRESAKNKAVKTVIFTKYDIMINIVIVILVTKFGDLFGCLGFLNAIKVIKRRENYAKYGE
jgi:hypothetical protein